MTPETIKAIQDALTPISAKIGEGAEYTWQVLVAGRFAEGVAELGVAALCLAIVHAGAYVLYRNRRYVAENMSDEIYLVFGVILLLPLIIGAYALYSGILDVVAPEYSALKMLLELAAK